MVTDGLTAVRTLEEIRAVGYAGGCSILKDFVRPLRSQAVRRPHLRFETEPGVQAQVDLSPYTVLSGVPTPVVCFSLVLGYSRWQYLRFLLHADVPAGGAGGRGTRPGSAEIRARHDFAHRRARMVSRGDLGGRASPGSALRDERLAHHRQERRGLLAGAEAASQASEVRPPAELADNRPGVRDKVARGDEPLHGRNLPGTLAHFAASVPPPGGLGTRWIRQ